VVVTDLMRKMVFLNVISRPTNVLAKLNVIAKIRKYRGLHEGHHFIPLAMEVHNTLGRDMDCFIKECARLFHDRQLKGHYPCFFAFNFSSNMLILLFNVL
jgi:hypothetical protein